MILDLRKKKIVMRLPKQKSHKTSARRNKKNQLMKPLKLTPKNLIITKGPICGKIYGPQDVNSDTAASQVYENSSSSSYQIDYKEVRDHLSVNIEGYARSLLGNETKRLSHAREMVWDQKGSKVSMNRRTGQWQDFKSGEKGDLIGLTSYVKGGDKHEAYRYAADYLGLKDSNRIDTTQNLLKEKIAAKQAETDKLDQQKLEKGQAQLDQLVRLSQPIKGSLAELYLRSHRGIKEADLGTDLRFLPVSQKDQVYKPGLLSIARDKDNEITSCQVTYLDPKTGNKATDIKVNKRTFGKISGSFVEIQKSDGSCKDKVYVAEGVETALSLKEAGIKGHIVAGLGLHNLDKADYFGKDIVIVGDNDGKNSQTQKRIEKVIQSYGEKSINITLAQPDRIGQDFNDVLKESGTEAVVSFFKTTIHNNNQQELRDGDKTHNPTTYIGSPSQEKSQLEEGTNPKQANGRKNSQATSQNQSQGLARDSSVDGSTTNKDNCAPKFDIDAWKAEMERKYPEEVRKIQESIKNLTKPLSSDPIDFKTHYKVSTGETLNKDKESYSFIKELEEKYPEESKKIRESMRGIKPEMNLESRLREVQDIMGREKDRSYYEEQLGLKFREHLDSFKDNFKAFREIKVNESLKGLHKDLIQEFKPEVFEREISRMSYKDLSEKLITYKQSLDDPKHRDHLMAKEDFKCFLGVARESDLKKLQKACDYDQNSKDFVYKALGIEQKQPQPEKSRGFER